MWLSYNFDDAYMHQQNLYGFKLIEEILQCKIITHCLLTIPQKHSAGKARPIAGL